MSLCYISKIHPKKEIYELMSSFNSLLLQQMISSKFPLTLLFLLNTSTLKAQESLQISSQQDRLTQYSGIWYSILVQIAFQVSLTLK